jgi:bacteriorhodopsin
MTVILWIGYPIIFALTEGAAKISVDAEVIAYGVLDVVSPPAISLDILRSTDIWLDFRFIVR